MAEARRQDHLLSRSRPPTSHAAQYMETQISIGGQEGNFCAQLGSFTPLEEAVEHDRRVKEMWARAAPEREELTVLIRQVHAKLDGKKGSQNIALSTTRAGAWDNVMQEVQMAGNRWKDCQDTSRTTKVCIDKIGGNSAAFRDWLQLVPNSEYTSSICGVFTLLISAAGHAAKVHETIYEALAEIPDIIGRSRRSVELYRDFPNPRLEEISFDLCLAVIRSLSHIMRFFLESRKRSLAEAFLKQSSYKRDLTASIDEVNKQADRLRQEAAHCHQVRGLQTDENVRHLGRQMHEGFNAIYKLLNDETRKPNEPRSTDPLVEWLQRRLLGAGATSFSSYRCDDDDDDDDDYDDDGDLESPTFSHSSRRTLAPPPTNRTPTRGRRTPKQLRRLAQSTLSALALDLSIPVADVEAAVRIGQTLDELSMSRASQMTRNESFRVFITEQEESTALLVNGHDDGSSCEATTSPLSFVAAQLCRAAGCMGDDVFVVRWFCGAHPFRYGYGGGGSGGPGDEEASPVYEMLASMAGQLLAQMLERKVRVDVEGCWRSGAAGSSRSPARRGGSGRSRSRGYSDGAGGDDEEDEQEVEKWHKALTRKKKNPLWKLFSRLLEQLPAGSVVICVLDELHQYEISALAEETWGLVRKLVKVVDRDPPLDVVFKLLVTCRERGLSMSHHFTGEGRTLDLDEDLEEDEAALWSVTHVGEKD